MLSIYILFCFLASTLSLKLIRSNTNYYPNRINNNHHHSFKLYSSSGAALELKNVFISIGNNDIISNINWAIMPKERWALVGPNGAGNDENKYKTYSKIFK